MVDCFKEHLRILVVLQQDLCFEISAQVEMANTWHKATALLLILRADTHADDMAFPTEPQNPWQ